MKVESRSDERIHVVAENKMEHCILTNLFEDHPWVDLDIMIGKKVLKSMPIILDDFEAERNINES